MASKRARLDRFISTSAHVSLRDVKLLLVQNKIRVNDEVVFDADLQVDEFSKIECNDILLQNNYPLYMMLHKPVGVVSATKDDQHKTVIDIINHPAKKELHIVGRLDLNTSGLLLLTNDGRWSKKLTNPESKVAKVYRVKVGNPITRDYKAAFAEGMHFPFEEITTKPVQLEILSDYEALLTLTEGRYHQIKRMFGRFRNPVVELHRVSIGGLTLFNELGEELENGCYRTLNEYDQDLAEKSLNHVWLERIFDL